MCALITKTHMYMARSVEDSIPKPKGKVHDLWVAILSPVHRFGCGVQFCSALHSIQTS